MSNPTIRHPKWRAAVCGRAGRRGRLLAVLRQFESSLSPRGVYFIIRRPERLERTRRRGGFDAAPPHGQDYFWGENEEFLETFLWFFAWPRKKISQERLQPRGGERHFGSFTCPELLQTQNPRLSHRTKSLYRGILKQDRREPQCFMYHIASSDY